MPGFATFDGLIVKDLNQFALIPLPVKHVYYFINESMKSMNKQLGRVIDLVKAPFSFHDDNVVLFNGSSDESKTCT